MRIFALIIVLAAAACGTDYSLQPGRYIGVRSGLWDGTNNPYIKGRIIEIANPAEAATLTTEDGDVRTFLLMQKTQQDECIRSMWGGDSATSEHAPLSGSVVIEGVELSSPVLSSGCSHMVVRLYDSDDPAHTPFLFENTLPSSRWPDSSGYVGAPGSAHDAYLRELGELSE